MSIFRAVKYICIKWYYMIILEDNEKRVGNIESTSKILETVKHVRNG
jgi:hypothetical protein